MDLSAALVVNIALDLIAFASVLALAAWAIRSGDGELQGSRGFRWRSLASRPA